MLLNYRHFFYFCLILCAFMTNMEASVPFLPSPEKIDKIFKNWDRFDSPGTSLLVIQNGKVVYKQRYGMANLQSQIHLQPSTLFDLTSTSEQFTGLCIAMLIQDGIISLGDNIRTYFPELPDYHGKVITIKDLVYQTSGLSNYTTFMAPSNNSQHYPYSVNDVIVKLSKINSLEFKPGEKFDRSNTNYLLLGELVKRITGSTLHQFAEKYIFTPLQMSLSSYYEGGNIPNAANGYSKGNHSQFHLENTQSTLVGCGGVYSNINDLFSWDQNFYHNRLGNVGQELINLTLTQTHLKNGTLVPYAFGSFIKTYRGLKLLGIEGDSDGFCSAFARFPDQKFSVIILSNLSGIKPASLALKVADLFLKDQMQ